MFLDNNIKQVFALANNNSLIILNRFITNFQYFLDRIKVRDSKATTIYSWIANLEKWISWIWIWIVCARLVCWLWILGLAQYIWGAQTFPGLGHSGWIKLLKRIEFDWIFPQTCSLQEKRGWNSNAKNRKY